MRIYSSKTYIIWPVDPKATPQKVDGKALRDLVKNIALTDGDTVYEASVFAQIKERRSVSIELVDAGGIPVEGIDTELELPCEPGTKDN